MKDKNIIQRNLPLNTKYYFVSAKYISIFDGGGCCDNCGKIISNIVTVKNDKGEYFNIGTDCADTLTSLKSELFFNNVSGQFAEGKSIRAKYQSNLKKGNITAAYYYECTDKTLLIVFKIKKGGTATQRINYPDITFNYLKDLNIQFKQPA